MLKIGEFSGLSRISVRMLRYYNELGLLRPDHVDETTGYRYYREDQLALAARIADLRDMGFGVTAIGEVIFGGDEALEHALRLRRAELIRERQELWEQLNRLEIALQRLGKDESRMKYEVSIKTLPERYVASVRGVLPVYAEEGRLWHTMMKELGMANVRQAQPCYGLGIYHDLEYRDHDVDVEIQLAVEGKHQDTEHVKFKTVPPILMASATYQGSYAKLSEVNASVAEWVRDNGYAFAGPNFTIDHVSPHDTQNPDELVTEVCYPVKKKSE